jgi:uncharacterized protein
VYWQVCETCTVAVMTDRKYLPRIADQTLQELIVELPALMVTGPRACGKTTSARRLAAEVLHLDDPTTAAAVAADPDAALRRAKEPLLLDEWQEVPSVLGAVKRAVDVDSRPGRFLLTGSAEAAFTSAMWPGTGRVTRVTMRGLSQREIVQGTNHPGLLPILLTGLLDQVNTSSVPLDLNDYIGLAAKGGFPEPALRLGPRARNSWLAAYLEHVAARDAIAAEQGRDPTRLMRYLEALGLSTAGLPQDSTLAAAAELNRSTARSYDDLLVRLYLLDLLPAWTTNRLSRLTKRSKRYLIDSGLAMRAARLEETTVLRDSDLLGRMIDTFVVAQLRSEIDHFWPQIRMFHLRSESGRHEIDVILDLGQDRVIAIEIKASSAPNRRDARHLIWLRDLLGDNFVRGVVFHTGSMPFELDERIWALPINCLWADHGTSPSE